MSMPIDLFLIRHGDSEGNVANRFSRKGDNSYFTTDFRNRHDSKWRLTEKGQQQAIVTGNYIKKYYPHTIDSFYVSDYIRAKETAALLDLPQAWWKVEPYLREREWGQLVSLTHDELHSLYGEVLNKRDVNSYYWRPPGGESMADLVQRIDRVLDTLHRECSNKRVVMVCHGEVMWAFRIKLQRLSVNEFIEMSKEEKPEDKINNCQVIHYSRLKEPGYVTPTYEMVTSFCPQKNENVVPEWKPIRKNKLSNQDLLDEVNLYPQLIHQEQSSG